MTVAPVEEIDVVALIKAAQALCGEIVPVTLIETLMRIALEQAGAGRGLLLLPEGEGWRIAAQATADDGEPVAVTVASEANTVELPAAWHQVLRTRASLLLDGADAPQLFPAPLPAAASGQRPRSTLCIPLLKQAEVVGLLHLENRLPDQAFTPPRIAMLELLAAQAAISLANANFCAKLLRENDERKQAEAALSASRTRFAAILDSALEAIITIDAGQHIVFFNAAAERMFGWPAAEAIGEPLDRLIPARLRAAHREHVRRFAESGTSQRVMGMTLEVSGLRPNGEEFPVDAAISQVDCGGQKLLTVMLRDITERQRVAAELRQHREHLEELVAARTAELVLAKGKAEEADRLKSVFLMSMSHELRTPLNAILGYTQILARNPSLDERQVEGLSIIRQSGEYLLALINDILDLSKIEAGRFELSPGPVDLPLFLHTVAEIIAVKAEQKGLSFACEAAPDLPGTVLVDEKRLRQVLLNLLGNAVKFTDRGAVVLCVQPLAGDQAQVRLRFEIQDSGVGIDAERLAIIFQPFEPLGASQPRSGGTGLGLAISRQLVRLMGSDIDAASQPGQGSRFWFELTLPRAVEALAAATQPAPRAVTGYRGPRKKLLIADDVAANRRMLASLLDSLGFAVCEAGDGRAAVAQVQAERPDLILMDVRMPLLDGPAAIRRIHELPGCHTLPVLAVSAGAASAEQALSLAAGASAFLVKPIDHQRLLELLGQHLDLSWIEAPPPASAGPLLVPPPDEMAILRQLALTGSMRDIRQRGDHLQALDPRYGPFADQLRDLARRYQSQAILALVNHYLKESEP